jgi:hypothetical protein
LSGRWRSATLSPVSILVAGTVAGAYAALVLGAHRWNVWRRRVKSGGFGALERLDWDALLQGLLPTLPGEVDPQVPAQLPSGLPTPALLRASLPPEAEPRRALLLQIVAGAAHVTEPAAFLEAGYSGGEARWLSILAMLKRNPDQALEKMTQQRVTSAQELYLREHLRLTRTLNPLNLEVGVFASKGRLAAGLARYGEVPCLYLCRALASSKVGFNRAAIDDLARAVYFSGQAPFYLRLVLDTPFLTEARPALVFQCRQTAVATGLWAPEA